jgi:hypothetical protein
MAGEQRPVSSAAESFQKKLIERLRSVTGGAADRINQHSLVDSEMS